MMKDVSGAIVTFETTATPENLWPRLYQGPTISGPTYSQS